MANVRTGNVIVVDTSAAFAGVYNIESIRWLPAGSTPSVTIKKTDSSGAVMYENANASAIWEEIDIRSPAGIYVTLVGSGAKVYLYLE